MKKLLVVACLLVACSILQAAEVMNDTLDVSGTLEGNGWDTTYSNWLFSTSGYGNPANYAWGGGGTGGAEDIDSGSISKDTGYIIQYNDLLSLTIDLRDMGGAADSSILSSLYYIDGVDEVVIGSAEYLAADIPGGWNDGLCDFSARAPLASVGSNLYVKIEGGPNSWNGTSAQRLGVDNIVVNQETSLASLPVSPADGAPADGTTWVEGSATLTWEVARDPNIPANPHPSITGINLYFDPNEALVTAGDASVLIPLGASVESYDPTPDMSNNEEYFWRVDTIISNANDIEGDVWSFETTKTVPVIIQQPTGVFIDPNPADPYAETGITIEVESASAVSYAWYEGLTGDTTTPVGEDQAALVFNTDLTSDYDQKVYWCRATNAAGSDDSDAALLTVKVVMGAWEFEDSLLNALGDGRDADIADPNYADGIDGRALELFADGHTAEIINSSDAYNTDSFTVSTFVKTGNTPSNSGLISQRVTTPDAVGWRFSIIGGGTSVLLDGIGTLGGGPSLISNTWHLLTLTYNGATGEAKLFVDGDQVDVITSQTGFVPSASPLIIGTDAQASTNYYSGLVDRVYVYNYPRSPLEIATEYTEYTGIERCWENPQFDLTGPEGAPDCVVDLYDFAGLAAQWLECNLLPESSCL